MNINKEIITCLSIFTFPTSRCLLEGDPAYGIELAAVAAFGAALSSLYEGTVDDSCPMAPGERLTLASLFSRC